MPGRAAGITLIRRPYLQNVQRDCASILWTSASAGSGLVVVTSAGGGTVTVPASVRTFAPATTQLAATFYQYQADVTGLDPGISYSYRVSLNGTTPSGGTGGFRTAAPGRFSFLVYGDTGENTPQQRSLVQLMGSEPDISFLMHTGDLAYPQADFALLDSNHFALNAPLLAWLPIFPTAGNHEYLVNSAAPYLSAHSFPQGAVNPADAGRYYSFDWGDAHFTCVDSNLMASVAGDRMLEWLDDDLASTRQYWKIVYFHHPPYPTGHHLGDVVCAAVHATVNPIVERHGVQLVVAGHEHGYERTAPVAADGKVDPGFGTVYLISGGGGADLHDVNSGGLTDIALETYHYLRVDIDGGTLTLRATGLDGGTIERYVIQPKPVIQERGVLSTGDYSQTLAPGSLVSVFGQNLAVEAQAGSAPSLPVELGGVRVRLDGEDMPLVYVSPGQVNAQIPWDAQPQAVLEVVTPNGSAQAPVSLLPTAPAILAVMTRGAAATPGNMATAGGIVTVYAAGLGPCAGAAAAPSTTVTSGMAPVIGSVNIWLGDQQIQPSAAGQMSDFPGVYQVVFTVPGVSAGSYPLRVVTSDASSRSVSLAVG